MLTEEEEQVLKKMLAKLTDKREPGIKENLMSQIGSIGMGSTYQQSPESYLGDDPSYESLVNGSDTKMNPSTVLLLTRLISSDVDLKKIDEDEGKTYIKAKIKEKHKLTPKDVKVLLKSFKVGDYQPRDAKHWKDSVLDDYAKYIKNFSYNYTSEAKKMDPSTDTAKTHIGPMAQDIEKVNPSAVIKDDATGYLSVDTGRLALMNAGAIAELARELKGIESRSVADAK